LASFLQPSWKLKDHEKGWVGRAVFLTKTLPWYGRLWAMAVLDDTNIRRCFRHGRSFVGPSGAKSAESATAKGFRATAVSGMPTITKSRVTGSVRSGARRCDKRRRCGF